MKTINKIFCAAAILLFLPAIQIRTAPEPRVAPELLNHLWSASWIACPGAPEREFGVYLFRKDFSLGAAPEHFVVHASGDNRYQLYVNGARVLEGPAKGDLFHWRFETLDIAPYLHPGSNAIAAIVWNFAEAAPMAQMTNETGLVLAGDGAAALVNTNRSWKVLRSRAFEMIAIGGQTSHAYTVVGPGERIDASLYPWGWQRTDFDDSAWQPASELVRAGPRGVQDSPSRWMLVPRKIPLMQQSVQRLKQVRRYSGPSGFQPTDAFLGGHSPLSIPANSHATLLLDQTFETTAYPELITSGGRGAVITLTYAEALFDSRHQKGNRNQIEGKHILGYTDQFLPDGGQHRVFQPLWWRAYRYVKLDVTTGAEPLTLDDFYGEFTAYPFTQRARFESNDPSLEKIMRVGWRTARLCAHETYMDCPYYEQLQYVGDTRIQALISLYMTGDDRLVKNAIECINASRTSEGLTQSRFPSRLPQYIPPFSLYWIGMMHDLWWYRGDA
ncbi:MAG TPA: alpha-L-rhamnosidase N-terminal domain-containing protein, partial [Terriglobia bacterium]|nr:alpha-L-rhamnosidase N-terminal domain-containing protein [Terriglobia bacterium]